MSLQWLVNVLQLHVTNLLATTTLALASSLRAMTSNLTVLQLLVNVLQLASTLLVVATQPLCDGLEPKGDDLQPTVALLLKPFFHLGFRVAWGIRLSMQSLKCVCPCTRGVSPVAPSNGVLSMFPVLRKRTCPQRAE